MVPKVNTQGMMDSRLRRILDFAMNSRLAIYLCDHSRPMSVLFEKLECKLSLNVEPPILSRNEFWSKMTNLVFMTFNSSVYSRLHKINKSSRAPSIHKHGLGSS